MLEGRVEVYPGVGYTSFLVPGLVMMSVLQNAFANSSSSLVQSKITGNLVFLLVTPLSHWAWFAAYVGASVVRGLAVGSGVLAVTLWFAPLHLAEPGWIIVFGMLRRRDDGLAGPDRRAVGGEVRPDGGLPELPDHADDDALGRVLFGAFAAPFWQTVSQLNPFFYMIDGFRHGFFGDSDVSPWLSLAVVASAFAGVALLALRLLASGYKLRQ